MRPLTPFCWGQDRAERALHVASPDSDSEDTTPNMLSENLSEFALEWLWVVFLHPPPVPNHA